MLKSRIPKKNSRIPKKNSRIPRLKSRIPKKNSRIPYKLTQNSAPHRCTEVFAPVCRINQEDNFV